MVEAALSEERPSREDEALLDLVFSHFHGGAIVRDIPDLTLQVAEHLLDMNRPVTDRVRHEPFARRELEHAFGLDTRRSHEDFPASAYHGPYLRLLWDHPAKGMDLVVRLMNRCCDAYGDPENYVDHIEPPGRISIELPDGSRHEQWGNWRLWGLYRGASVGPYGLQSALMALERWLLEKGERGDADLPDVLLHLLTKSNNVAVTAVIVSVALAHPFKVGDVGYCLLTCPQFFDADLQRMTHDLQGGHYGGMDFLGADKVLYSKERWESHSLPHRKHRLEQLAVLLQSTSQRDKILKLIDRYKAELPPESEQGDNVRLWRLKLHDIDVRNFVKVGETDDGGLLYHADTPPAELQKLRDDAKPLHEAREAVMGLWTWGMAVFGREKKDYAKPEDWREKLALAQAQLARQDFKDDQMHLMCGLSGPAYVAAICVRDHWEELTAKDQEWCVNLICDAVDEDADANDRLTIGSLNPMGGSRPSAFILTSLFSKKMPESVHNRLLPTLAKAVGHAVEEVVRSVVDGIGTNLWLVDRGLAITCLQALVYKAQATDSFLKEQRTLHYKARRQQEDFEVEIRGHVRKMVIQRDQCDETQIAKLDLAHWPGRAVAADILSVVGKQPDDPLAIQIMGGVATALAESWA